MSVGFSPGRSSLPSPPVAELFGGAETLHRAVEGPLDVHELLLHGLPGEALAHLIANIAVHLRTGSLERAVGMSVRTFQRVKDAPERPLSPEHSGRAWKFAEILARATAALGSQQAAEAWLDTPATSLDRHRPIDLLATPAGLGLVEDLLGRMEHGVYT